MKRPLPFAIFVLLLACGGSVVSERSGSSTAATSGTTGSGGEGNAVASTTTYAAGVGGGGGCTGCIEYSNGDSDGPLCDGAVAALNAYMACMCVQCEPHCGDATVPCWPDDPSFSCEDCLLTASLCPEEFHACQALDD